MTHRSAAVPSLPLSVTCSADPRFAATITALATRVVAGAGGDAEAATRFARAVTSGVEACLEHLDGARGEAVTVELTASDTAWQGSVSWPFSDADAAFVATLEGRLESVADRVECGLRGADAFCTVSCTRG